MKGTCTGAAAIVGLHGKMSLVPGAIAICDSIFELNAVLKPIPRRNQVTVYEPWVKRAISSLIIIEMVIW